MPWSDFAPAEDAPDREQQVARLFTACEAGDNDRAFLVLKACEKQRYPLDEMVNARTPDGATPLFYAAKGGHDVVVETLLATGQCVVNAATAAGFTPLFIAALRGRAGAVGVLLNEYGVAVNQPAKDGRTALYAACEAGCVKSCRLLLKAGAQPSVGARRRPDNSTPLIVAAYLGHAAVVQVLLDAGAKLTPADDDGTALANARRQRKHEVVEILERAMKEKGWTEEDLDAPVLVPP